ARARRMVGAGSPRRRAGPRLGARPPDGARRRDRARLGARPAARLPGARASRGARADRARRLRTRRARAEPHGLPGDAAGPRGAGRVARGAGRARPGRPVAAPPQARPDRPRRGRPRPTPARAACARRPRDRDPRAPPRRELRERGDLRPLPTGVDPRRARLHRRVARGAPGRRSRGPGVKSVSGGARVEGVMAERTLAPGEWAVLALLSERPSHGWAVSSQLDPSGELGSVWSLGRPLVYRSIDILAERGLIE